MQTGVPISLEQRNACKRPGIEEPLPFEPGATEIRCGRDFFHIHFTIVEYFLSFNDIEKKT